MSAIDPQKELELSRGRTLPKGVKNFQVAQVPTLTPSSPVETSNAADLGGSTPTPGPSPSPSLPTDEGTAVEINDPVIDTGIFDSPPEKASVRPVPKIPLSLIQANQIGWYKEPERTVNKIREFLTDPSTQNIAPRDNSALAAAEAYIRDVESRRIKEPNIITSFGSVDKPEGPAQFQEGTYEGTNPTGNALTGAKRGSQPESKLGQNIGGFLKRSVEGVGSLILDTGAGLFQTPLDILDLYNPNDEIKLKAVKNIDSLGERAGQAIARALYRDDYDPKGKNEGISFGEYGNTAFSAALYTLNFVQNMGYATVYTVTDKGIELVSDTEFNRNRFKDVLEGTDLGITNPPDKDRYLGVLQLKDGEGNKIETGGIRDSDHPAAVIGRWTIGLGADILTGGWADKATGLALGPAKNAAMKTITTRGDGAGAALRELPSEYISRSKDALERAKKQVLPREDSFKLKPIPKDTVEKVRRRPRTNNGDEAVDDFTIPDDGMGGTDDISVPPPDDLDLDNYNNAGDFTPPKAVDENGKLYIDEDGNTLPIEDDIAVPPPVDDGDFIPPPKKTEPDDLFDDDGYSTRPPEEDFPKYDDEGYLIDYTPPETWNTEVGKLGTGTDFDALLQDSPLQSIKQSNNILPFEPTQESIDPTGKYYTDAPVSPVKGSPIVGGAAVDGTTVVKNAEGVPTSIKGEVVETVPSGTPSIDSSSIVPPADLPTVVKGIGEDPGAVVNNGELVRVKRSNEDLTELGKRTLDPETRRPIINPARKEPLTNAELLRLQEKYGSTFDRWGPKIDGNALRSSELAVITDDGVVILKQGEMPDSVRIKPAERELFAQAKAVKESIENGEVDNLVRAKEKLEDIKASADGRARYRYEAHQNLPDGLKTGDIDAGAAMVRASDDLAAAGADLRKAQDELVRLQQERARVVADFEGTAPKERGNIYSELRTADANGIPQPELAIGRVDKAPADYSDIVPRKYEAYVSGANGATKEQVEGILRELKEVGANRQVVTETLDDLTGGTKIPTVAAGEELVFSGSNSKLVLDDGIDLRVGAGSNELGAGVYATPDRKLAEAYADASSPINRPPNPVGDYSSGTVSDLRIKEGAKFINGDLPIDSTVRKMAISTAAAVTGDGEFARNFAKGLKKDTPFKEMFTKFRESYAEYFGKSERMARDFNRQMSTRLRMMGVDGAYYGKGADRTYAFYNGNAIEQTAMVNRRIPNRISARNARVRVDGHAYKNLPSETNLANWKASNIALVDDLIEQAQRNVEEAGAARTSKLDDYMKKEKDLRKATQIAEQRRIEKTIEDNSGQSLKNKAEIKRNLTSDNGACL